MDKTRRRAFGSMMIRALESSVYHLQESWACEGEEEEEGEEEGEEEVEEEVEEEEEEGFLQHSRRRDVHMYVRIMIS
ncbi:hypothetical protein Tdes44962_MAKER09472 [Teratosphaeria destructans]|uniref:Uncharacterized protein n=1 Tax=Teratosphaeria destructans TaxID=418781 RepID=A0A9W7ST82_9PEZI|nr:hypothetical protein Tdes44962_MAKER09472 [Teratosphaeria destructans]